MATLKNIVRANPLSQMRQVASTGGASVWAGLADALDTAGKALQPKIDAAVRTKAGEEGYDAARANAPTVAYGRKGDWLKGDENLIGMARQAAKDAGVPEDLFLSLVQQESGWNPTAESPKGAFGLAQLMPDTASGLGVDPRDPAQNLAGGARYLAQQYEKYGDWETALAAYNAGPGNVDKHGGIPPFRETQDYVKTVFGRVGQTEWTGQGADDVPIRSVYQQMLADAPESVRSAVSVNNDYRTPEQQAQIIANNWQKFDLNPDDKVKWLADVESMGPEAAGDKWAPVFTAARRTAADGKGTPFRNWIALPGKSQHQLGAAADITFSSKEARQWFHDNAENYGAKFPLSNEPWHMEVDGAREGPVMRPPDTVAIMSDGSTKNLPMNPFLGDLARVYEASAKAAYVGEVENQAAVDLMEMSNQFPLDPEGFERAADAYIRQIVADSPAEFRAGIRDSIGRTAVRRATGLMAERQADIRTRAGNSNKASVERLSGEYAQMLAAGDEEGALTAASELRAALAVRERLPGLAWTPEQSENVMASAMETADGLIAKRDKAAADEAKSIMNDGIAVLKTGMPFEHEGQVIGNTAFQQADPELYEDFMQWKAVTTVAQGDKMLPPAMRMERAKAQIESAKGDANDAQVAEKYMEWTKADVAALESDPYQYMMENAPAQLKPPPLEAPDGSGRFAKSLSDRWEYALWMQQQGYTKSPVMLSETEAEGLSALFSDDAPPEIRAALASSIVEGAGPGAEVVFSALDVDEVTQFGGMLLSAGGKGQFVTEAMRGQALLREGVVTAPTIAKINEAMGMAFVDAFSGLPGGDSARKNALEFGRALYAARRRSDADAAEDAEILEGAVNDALGRSKNTRGEYTGGMIEVSGGQVVLPVTMSQNKAVDALQRAFLWDVSAPPLPASGLVGAAQAVFGSVFPGDRSYPDDVAEAWRAASSVGGRPDGDRWAGSVPMMGGEPLSGEWFEKGKVRIVPRNRSMYSLEILTVDGPVPARGSDGRAFVFNLQTLVDSLQ